MFSLVKSILSNIQKREELKILIIGECGSGKTSLFNLISSYDNKSKCDILNNEILQKHDHANCALGFNTKTIIFNKKNLKIYDLEGTATNTINIYDCYYDDSDVIFYVIDSRSEKHIFKTIIYLSYLYRNNINTQCNNKDKNEEYFKPIIILGNKSEDGTSFFSAPCIYNYIKTIDIHKNENIWNFVLSNDNIFLNYYLGVLYEKVVDYFIVNNCSFNAFISKEDKDENIYSEIIRKSSSLISNIKNNNKGYITVEEVECNELLKNIMKNIINEHINNYKNIPIEVYNISVFKNKGIYEVVEIMFEKYFKKEKHNNPSTIYRIHDEQVAYCNNDSDKEKIRDNCFYNKKNNYYSALNINDEFNSQNLIYSRNGNGNNRNNKLIFSYYPSNPINDYISEKNYFFRNNVYKKRTSKKKEKYLNNKKNNYIMYVSNNNSVNLFIKHMQHLHFGSDNYENIFDNFSFIHNKNVKNKNRLSTIKNIKQKGNINEFMLRNSERQNKTNTEEKLHKNNDMNNNNIKEKKEYNDKKLLIEKLNIENKEYDDVYDTYKEETEEKKLEENLKYEDKKENEERKDQHNGEEKNEVLHEEKEKDIYLKSKGKKQQVQTEHEKIHDTNEDKKNENEQENQNKEKEEKKELKKETGMKENKKKGICNELNHNEKETKEGKTKENVENGKAICTSVHENNGCNVDKKCDEFKSNSNHICEHYLKSINNLSSVSLLDSDTILKLAEMGEDSCKNVSKKVPLNIFEKNKEKYFILRELQNSNSYENIEQDKEQNEQEIKETVYIEENGDEQEEENGKDLDEQKENEEKEQEQENENENEKGEGEELREGQQEQKIIKKNNSTYEKMREENYTNNIKNTHCSYNKNESHENGSFCKENDLSNIKDGKINYIYKGKINKRRYVFIKKKKKKKFLFNIKLNNSEENSSSSFENVNLMNIMCVDSLNKI